MVLQQDCLAIDLQAPSAVFPSIVASRGEPRANIATLKLAGDGKASAPMEIPARTSFRNSCIVVLSGTSNTLYVNTCPDTFQRQIVACRASGGIQIVSLKLDIRFGGWGDGSRGPKNNGSNFCQG